MANIEFLFGTESTLPTKAVEGQLLFTDKGNIYRGSGDDLPLIPYGSVLIGFTNLEDLQSKVTAPIIGKLYLTNDSKLYTYNGTAFDLISGSETMSSEAITFDGTGTDLTSANISDALKEVNAKVDALNLTVETLESALTGSLGKIKLTSADTNGYLGDKLHSTLVVDDGQLKVVNIDGLIIGASDINTWLTGTEGNVQVQINTLKDDLEAMATGLNYIGNFPSLTELQAVTGSLNGDLAVVTNESAGEASELYVYSEGSSVWQKLGKFEFSETFIGLKDTPANYEGSTGKVMKSNGTGLVFGEVTYDELVGKPNVSVADIEDAVVKKHEHDNATVLTKLGEDSNGNLTFSGNPVAPQWGTFEI